MTHALMADMPFLAPECISMSAALDSTMNVFAHAALLLQRRYRVRAQVAQGRLARRELRRTTALGFGVALPHADMPGLTRPVAAFVRVLRPMNFGAPDLLPVSDFLVMLAPRPATGRDFDVLCHYRQLLVTPPFRQALTACGDAGVLWQLFRRHEWNGYRDRAPWIMPALPTEALS